MEQKNRSYMKRHPSLATASPYIMPWANLECSFVYNMDILLDTVHTTSSPDWTVGSKWTAVPETVDEFLAYCTDINAAGNVAPLVWGGLDGLNWFAFPIYVWWAQQQGAYVKNANNPNLGANEGSYYDFFDFAGPEVWKQTGIQTAIDIWRSIIVDENAGKDDSGYKNTLPLINELTIQDAEKEFVKGNTAMILGGSFLEAEMKDFIGKDGNPEFTMKMTAIPFSENCATNPDGSKTKMHFVSSDAFMCVPSKAVNKDLAKEFLAFISSESQVLQFTDFTGCMRPFDYDPVELTKNNSNYAWSEFEKSCFDLAKNSDVSLYLYPGNAPEGDYSPIYVYKNPDLFVGLGVNSVAEYMKKYTGKQIMVDGDGSNFSSVYKQAESHFSDWKLELGMDD